jgi:small basic protein
MLALFGLLVGALVAFLLQPSVPQDLSRYVAVVAAVDAGLGGVRSALERTFNDRIFVIAFLSNAAVAIFLVWVGDQLGADLSTAVVVVLGVRIFQNLAAIRRRVFGG